MLEDKNVLHQLLERGRINIPDKSYKRFITGAKSIRNGLRQIWKVQDAFWERAQLNIHGYSVVIILIHYKALSLQVTKISKRDIESYQRDVREANRNGRILHEMAFNAFVSHKGNTQETAHFVIAVWNVYKWTGDNKFLADMYPYMQKV